MRLWKMLPWLPQHMQTGYINENIIARAYGQTEVNALKCKCTFTHGRPEVNEHIDVNAITGESDRVESLYLLQSISS